MCMNIPLIAILWSLDLHFTPEDFMDKHTHTHTHTHTHILSYSHTDRAGEREGGKNMYVCPSATGHGVI